MPVRGWPPPSEEAHIQSYLILPDKAKRVGDAAICSRFTFTRSPQLTISYRGDLDLLRQELPLAIVDVTAEVNDLLEDVQIAADTYLSHLLARIVYHLLKTREPYRAERAADYDHKRRERELKHLARRAQKLGYTLTGTPTTTPDVPPDPSPKGSF